MKIALATYDGLPSLTSHEAKLIPLFASKGILAEPVIWSSPKIDWKKYDGVIIRSVWDYHKRIDEFLKWLSHLEEIGVKCWNPTAIIRQNSAKTYLKDLEEKGVKIIPTYWLSPEDIPRIPTILEENGWNKAIVKPIVSATAYKTFMFHVNEVSEWIPKIQEAFEGVEVFMLQKFMPEISTLGEWSVVFFNKTFSHAALKTAKEGEFRVQSDFGGSTSLEDAPKALISQAGSILNLYNEPFLYTRVDGLWIDGEFWLMELELIEPELFLNTSSLRNRFVEAFLLAEELD